MDNFRFDMQKERSSIIKVLGVGGGGGNAVNHMYSQGIKGVDFIICNTDAQDLEKSSIPNKIQLGASLTEGLGAGSQPEVGKNAAIESVEDIKQLLGPSTKMIFITAGMGGGTGTGASPVIARACRELGILTVAIVTMPFTFEGPRRRQQAEEGLAELKGNVDAIIAINNDKLREMFGNLPMRSAFAEADNVLATAAKGIAEIITIGGIVNRDFRDVKTVMENSGVALMGYAATEGDNRAIRAVEMAMSSPLLDNSNIAGARYVLLNISSSSNNEITMDEVNDITDFIQQQAGSNANVLWGLCQDDTLGDKVSVTLIASGFQPTEKVNKLNPNERKVVVLDTDKPEEPTAAVVSDTVEESIDEMEPVLKKANELKQVSMFDFLSAEPTLKQKEESAPEYPAVEMKAESPAAPATPPAAMMPSIPSSAITQADTANSEFDEQLRRSKERINKLKELSMKLRMPNGIAELENEPAYKRRNMNLDDVPHSSEETASRFTLTKDEEGKVDIRPGNNSFLHDNVD